MHNNPFEDLRKEIFNSIKPVSPSIKDNAWDPLWGDQTQPSESAERKLLEQERIIKAYHKVFKTPEGELVLKHLISLYLDQGVYALGMDGEQSRNWAIWRDGNNEVVRGILKFVRYQKEG